MMMMMAQYSGSIYWWRANVVPSHSINPSYVSGVALRSFINPSLDNAELGLGLGLGLGKFMGHCSSSGVICFRDDNCPFTESPLEREAAAILRRSARGRTNSEIGYSPWAASMLNGLPMRESRGGGGEGGRGSDDDGGGGGGGGGGDDDDEGDGHIFLLPLLTMAFAAFHLGYCIAVWVKNDHTNDDNDFLRMGLGLFCLLVLAAVRLNNQTGIDAYILGLGASIGVMVWTGERCFVKHESNPAGIVALFAASMAVMFTAALYHNI